MVTLQQNFLDLRAADLMSREVLTVPVDMFLRDAARLLSQAMISGAPVVDEKGRCVGVLSATDFMHRVERTSRPARRMSRPADCVCSEWQIVDFEAIPMDRVRDVMTTDIVTVHGSLPVRELARLMLDAHIHRLVVVDEADRPVGIVSSTDILAAVARAAN
jgi:CBS-domain-containing membrane protein